MSAERLVALVAAALVALAAGTAAAADEGDTVSPHARMIGDTGVCTECHTRVPAAGERARDHLLGVRPSEICLGCHSEYEHAGTKEHLGRDAGRLIGDENGKIACFTCHDPHPAGVIPGRRVYRFEVDDATHALAAAHALPRGATRRDPGERFGGLLRFPTRDAEGCRVCHDAPRDGTLAGRRPFPHALDRLLLY